VKKSSFALFPSIEDYHTVVYIFPSINWDMGYFSISSGTHNGVTLKIDWKVIVFLEFGRKPFIKFLRYWKTAGIQKKGSVTQLGWKQPERKVPEQNHRHRPTSCHNVGENSGGNRRAWSANANHRLSHCSYGLAHDL